ncbi:hypothetical protein GACE_0603 [Geoglobus acetivorans]|uniref:Uncharacterized protein n=1 Tax=Geoglobus acetivorans TaxID=565033 RepID=A0A0A7GC90_GEOAI|nr:hypothetical protein GACE_0603 [Geoglobus acetivorans]
MPPAKFPPTRSDGVIPEFWSEHPLNTATTKTPASSENTKTRYDLFTSSPHFSEPKQQRVCRAV